MTKSIGVFVDLPRHHRNIDFDQRKVRKTITKEAREVRKVARRLVSRRAVSKAGEFPGRQSGELMNSIKVTTSKKYMFAMIMPRKTANMEVFYPEILVRGSKRRPGKLAEGEGKGRSNRRARGDRVKAMEERSKSGAYIIEPRANYMEAALDSRRAGARAAIQQALQDSLVPR